MQCYRHIPIRLLPSKRPVFNVKHNIKPTAKPAVYFNQTRQVSRSTTNSPFPFPVITTCPEPTCPCSTEAVPGDLKIDTTRPLTNTVPPYTQHVLISTGQSDWKSKIEDEIGTWLTTAGEGAASWGRFIHDLKHALGPKGAYHSPYDNVLVTASSFSARRHRQPEVGEIEALLFPAFRRVSLRGNRDPGIEEGTVRDFVQGFVRHKSSKEVGNGHRDGNADELLTSPPSTASSLSTTAITTPTVLICSHMSRDSRCGILGPLLRDEFAAQLAQKGFQVHNEEFDVGGNTTDDPPEPAVNIGLISHVGGHRWAGNVILYVPPNYVPPPLTTSPDQPPLPTTASPLSGTGIWYGRVAPQHVQGILEETLLRGNIIRELFRGVVGDGGRGVMRL